MQNVIPISATAAALHLTGQPTPAAPVKLVSCKVVIKMPDGSRGEHEGLYPHACDALDRALELFPEAKVIWVAVARGRRAQQ